MKHKPISCDIRSLSACARTRILEAWSRSKPASPNNFLLARHPPRSTVGSKQGFQFATNRPLGS